MEERTDLQRFKGFGTDAIHAGQGYDSFSGAVMTPISLSTTFAQKSPGEFYPGHYEYCRTGNPTRDTFENCVAALESAKYGAAFASGLAATATLLHLLKTGDHVITIDDVYGGTGRYFQKVAANNGLEFSFIDLSDTQLLEKEIRKETKMLWIETPTNPTLKIVDIKVLSEIAHKHNLLVVVDNTFMSPYFQRPLTLGADIVLHSISKYINGHSDVIGGVVCLNDEETYKRIKFLQNGMGAILSPFDSYLALRGVKTLHVRMERHASNAMAVAKFLENHPKVEKVTYPGLPSHPQHNIAKAQMTGYGGMITIYLKGGLQESRVFLENLKIFALAESLGGVESLAEHPAIMTHASVPPERRKLLGIGDNMCRLSVGIEDTEDIINDLKNALDKI